MPLKYALDVLVRQRSGQSNTGLEGRQNQGMRAQGNIHKLSWEYQNRFSSWLCCTVPHQVLAAVSWRAVCVGMLPVWQRMTRTSQALCSANICSLQALRATPLFLHGTDARAWHFPLLLGTKPSLTAVSSNPSALLLHSWLWGKLQAHLLCFMMSPMEKQTSLCFSSERCLTSGPSSSLRRSMCSRVCCTRYPTAPCWEGSRAWMCCRMSRTFQTTAKTGSGHVPAAAQLINTQRYSAGVSCKCPEMCHNISTLPSARAPCSACTQPFLVPLLLVKLQLPRKGTGEHSSS